MTRTAAHIESLIRLEEDRVQEGKQALLALSVVILFGGVTAAALMSLQRELHFMFPFILGLSVTGMGACYFVSSLSRIRSLKRQIEIIHEDTKL